MEKPKLEMHLKFIHHILSSADYTQVAEKTTCSETEISHSSMQDKLLGVTILGPPSTGDASLCHDHYLWQVSTWIPPIARAVLMPSHPLPFPLPRAAVAPFSASVQNLERLHCDREIQQSEAAGQMRITSLAPSRFSAYFQPHGSVLGSLESTIKGGFSLRIQASQFLG